MKKNWFIVKICDGKIELIKEQPKDGFQTDGQAESHLSKLYADDNFIKHSWFSFSIMPIWIKLDGKYIG